MVTIFREFFICYWLIDCLVNRLCICQFSLQCCSLSDDEHCSEDYRVLHSVQGGL